MTNSLMTWLTPLVANVSVEVADNETTTNTTMSGCDNVYEQHDDDTVTYAGLRASTFETPVPTVYEELALSEQHIYCNVSELSRKALNKN